MSEIFPDIRFFLSVWLLREAVYSSQIEGTQSSLSDLIIFEMDKPSEAVDDLLETANYVTAAAMDLFHEDAERIRSEMGASAASAMEVFRELQTRPIVSISALSRKIPLSKPTIHAAVSALQGIGIVRELTGRRRNRMFGYDRYLTLLQNDDSVSS